MQHSSVSLKMYEYIEAKSLKESLDREYRQKHPVRDRMDGEDFETYDSYLTAHADAYLAMLDSMKLGKLNTLDINLESEVRDLLQPYNHNKLNDNDLLHILLACRIYNFNEFDVMLPESSNWHVKSLLSGRKGLYRWLSDLTLWTIKDSNLKRLMVQYSKENNPTIITKIL